MQNSSLEMTRISLHSIKNLLGNRFQTSLFSDHAEEFSKKHGTELFNSITRFGVELSDFQMRVMEGLLTGFSQTDYKGNIHPQSLEEISSRYECKIPEAYKYIKEIPRLRITQAKFLELVGINKNSIACKTRALEALQELGSTQFCFYYERLAYDNNGNPLKNDDGTWKKEQVTTVDTLFTVRKVYEEGAENLKYYEISPCSIFLDQIEGYFMLIPYKWREEVIKAFGSKKASGYTFRFLVFLRYQYELKRRKKNSQDLFQLRWSPEEIAVALKMPESIYLRKKKRMNELLENAYSIAKHLGYLTEYQRLGYVDLLIFNNKKYTISSHPSKIQDPATSIASNLLEFFIDCRKSIDPCFSIDETQKNRYVGAFFDLSKARDPEDIKKLIKWSITQKYWSSRLATPSRLKEHFSESWIEYTFSIKLTLEERIEKNKYLSNKYLKCLEGQDNGKSRLTLLNKSVEFLYQNKCEVLEYSDKSFLEKLYVLLEKFGFNAKEILGKL